jgi:hypothetical protein
MIGSIFFVIMSYRQKLYIAKKLIAVESYGSTNVFVTWPLIQDFSCGHYYKFYGTILKSTIYSYLHYLHMTLILCNLVNNLGLGMSGIKIKKDHVWSSPKGCTLPQSTCSSSPCPSMLAPVRHIAWILGNRHVHPL